MMAAAEGLSAISVDDYLAGELASRVKHEYLGGYVYAMAGARNLHNAISTSIVVALGSRLRGKRCQPFNSDTKIRVRLPTHLRFYYPDASVVCRLNPPNESWQDNPAVIVEVLGRATRRIDWHEKKDAYLTIPTLAVYLLVEQDSASVSVYRRTEKGFVGELYTGQAAVIPLPEIETELPLGEVYDRVEFVPEVTAEDE